MADTQLFIVIDDSLSDSFDFGPTPWTSTALPEWFNGTSQVPNFASNNSGQFGTVQFKFQGTSVAFFGVTPSATDSQTFEVSIDGSPPLDTTYADPNPPTYRQWYQSPLLEEGVHNVFLSHIAGASIDFAAVTVGNDTPLSGQRIIADNDDIGFTYDGKWKRSQAQFNSGPLPDGNPYHNTTHQTNDIGDNFTYRFSGSSIQIYGIFTWSNLGLITLSFDLDNQTLSETFRVSSDTPQFLSELGQQQNFLVKSFDFLTDGNHTLVVKLTDCANQTFAFDYVTYTPSFPTLATMPNLTQTLPDLGEDTPAKRSLLGPIVGVVAGVMILGLFGVLVMIFRRRRSKGRYKPIYPFQHPQPPKITVIPLSDHYDSSAVASLDTYSDAADVVPRASTDTGLSYVSHVEGLSDRSNQIAGTLTPNRRPLPTNPGMDLPTVSGATVASLTSLIVSSERTPRAETAALIPLRGGRDASRQWDASVRDSGSLPPSYDETTLGRPPPRVAPAF